MEHLEVSQERESVEERARMIRARHSDGRTMSRRDQRLLSQLEGEERVLIRRERHLQAANLSWLNKCLKCCRPFEMVFGILFLLFGLLIFVSLLLTRYVHFAVLKFSVFFVKDMCSIETTIVRTQNVQIFFSLGYKQMDMSSRTGGSVT